MKKTNHPRYDWVIMQDTASDFRMLTRSTRTSAQKATWTDGKEYPVINVEVSSASHPFYTGTQKAAATGGRIERFHRKYGQS